MRIFSLIYMTALCMVLSSFGAHAQTDFFNDLPDIPLMEKIQELSDQTVKFDKPGGRITEVIAILDSGTQKEDVLAFYEQTLPQLGWQASNDQKSTFRRMDEVLTLKFEQIEDQHYLHLMVTPQ